MKYVILAAALLLGLISCCRSSVIEEVSRFPSPDGNLEAVWTRLNVGGATTGYSFGLYIVSTGQTPDWDAVVLSVDHIEGFLVNWRPERVLEIEFKYARIWHFTNYWVSDEIDDTPYVVELRLKPTMDDHSLSPYDRWPVDDNFQAAPYKIW